MAFYGRTCDAHTHTHTQGHKGDAGQRSLQTFLTELVHSSSSWRQAAEGKHDGGDEKAGEDGGE